MNFILDLLAKIPKKVYVYIILGIVVLSLLVALRISLNSISRLKETVSRQEANITNITKDVSTLNITLEDYKSIHTKDTKELDSVTNLYHITIKDLDRATIAHTNYVNTHPVIPTHGNPVPHVDIPKLTNTLPSFKLDRPQLWDIPVYIDSACWSMKGIIITTDKLAKLNILERSAINSIQLLGIKQHRFLGFLWVTRPAEFKAYSKCGEIKVSEFKFVKK